MNRARLTDISSFKVTGARIANRELSDERVLQRVLRILDDNVLCSIATVTAENRAHINTAYFCYSEELEMYFLSHPGSLHCQNLLANSSMAMTIFSSSQSWTDPGQGLQLFGTCGQASGHQNVNAERLYGERFPSYVGWRQTLKEGDLALAYRFYRFLPNRLKILDEKEFGDAVFVCAAINRERLATA